MTIDDVPVGALEINLVKLIRAKFDELLLGVQEDEPTESYSRQLDQACDRMTDDISNIVCRYAGELRSARMEAIAQHEYPSRNALMGIVTDTPKPPLHEDFELEDRKMRAGQPGDDTDPNNPVDMSAEAWSELYSRNPDLLDDDRTP